MAEYINVRNVGKSEPKKSSFFRNVNDFFSQSKTSEEMPDLEETEVIEYERKSFLENFLGRFFSKKTAREIEEEMESTNPRLLREVEDLEDEIEDVEEVVEDLEGRRESLIQKFLKAVRSMGRKEVEEEFEEMDVIGDEIMKPTSSFTDDELKSLFRKIHKWLIKLPSNEIAAFKESQDFEEFKEALNRLKLVR